MSSLMPFSRLAVLALASSLALAPVAYAKHAAFELPACDRLMEGDGPQAVKQEASNAAPVEGSKAEQPAGKLDLTPMKLTDDKDSFQVGKDGKMKVTVEENVAKSPETAAASPDQSQSVIKTDKGDLSDKLLKDAKKVNLGPIPVCETEDEAQKKMDAISDAERTQLTELWTATINKSPDIQFVINRLQPNSDPNHATATALKMIGGALFSAVQAVPFMMGPGMNSMVMYSGVSSGVGMLQQLMSGQDAKNAKKQQISQEQATILYKIVRDTADKLVLEYRRYRKSADELGKSLQDLEDLKAMVATARSGLDAAKQIEMEYLLRKAQRDADNISEELRLHRQQLTDLAGGDAVAKLDVQIDEEKTALAKLTGGDLSKPDELKAQPETVVTQPPAEQPVKVAIPNVITK